MQRRARKSDRFVAVALAIASIALSTSCQTTQTPTQEIEPVYPEIDFPSFPNPESEAQFLPAGTIVELPGGGRIELEADHVYMSLDYWLSVTDYVIDVRRAAGIYEALREASDGER